MTEHYSWRGGSEMLLRHGEGAKLTLLVLPALFEEANRMRRFTVSVMRALAARGISSVLPDLPGTGESLTDLSDVTLADWLDAASAVADLVRGDGGRCLSIAIRGGAILDSVADHGWRLAPESGERMLRDLVRATAMSGERSPTEVDRLARVEPTALAGQTLSPALFKALLLAPMLTANRRTVRLADDAGPRDISLAGSRLWRAAEPGDDPAMVEVAVRDIIDWIVTCGA